MTKYAKLYRNLVRAGLCVAVVCNVQIACAAYAQLTPPPGWSRTTSGAIYKAPSAQWLAGKAAADAAIRNASATSKIRVALTATPTAGRLLAGAIFMHPAVRLALGVSTLLSVAQIYWNVTEGRWEALDTRRELLSGFEYSTSYDPDKWYSSPDAACKGFASAAAAAGGWKSWSIITSNETTCWLKVKTSDDRDVETGFDVQKRAVECKPGWTSTPQGCLSPEMGTPVPIETEEDFARRILNPANQPGWPTTEGWPFPPTVPDELDIPVPVGDPVINPGTDGKPRPVFIPTGNPVPNPKYDPNAPASPTNKPWIRPGITVVPAPTPDDPWRVDVQPTEVPQDTSDPEDTPDPNEDPDAKPEPKNDADLCEKYPDILACAKPELDTPEGEIPKTEREVTLDDNDLFGGGSCPADAYANVGGQQLKVWNWQQSCDYITRFLKPVILVLGAFSALMIVSGGTKE